MLDENIPNPIRDLDKPFLLPLEHLYAIQGKYMLYLSTLSVCCDCCLALLM